MTMAARCSFARAAAVGLVLGVASPAFAVKYMTIGEAVGTFIPKGTKVFKVTKSVEPELRARIVRDYGWEPAEPQYEFYVGRDGGGQPLAYVFVVPEVFNTCFHKYAVGMKQDGEVIETVIVELSCPRAFPVNRKSFLTQFKAKRHTDALTTKLDVDAVTGATLSSEATAEATRKAVSLHNLFFGGAAPVKADPKIQAARAKGLGAIKKAIETGETLDKQGQGGGAQLPPESK
ncbi:MAG: FMN-binding protein [Deltaproteobacteria bacterium]|nr:FMN-binding protein [Deltaproteobacteria bacterium]